MNVPFQDYLSDILYDAVKPFFPRHHQNPHKAGRRREIDDRIALSSLLFILKHNMPWNDFQIAEASGISIYRRQIQWQEVDFFKKTTPFFKKYLDDYYDYKWYRIDVRRKSYKKKRLERATG